ncbi:MAG TPA: ATP-binding protein [Candidatus Polarisedimenticolaceae bacterium]|nr:ATP-binding protein [Candidatus Polarisedimenticolaceae bacterium]
MGRRIREMDWSETPLGPVEAWPQSLRSAVSFLLPSRAQIILFWGPDLVTLYNDAYRPVFGAKHPWALGLPAREAWSEIWDSTLEPLLGGVVETGEAYWASNRPFLLRRHGFEEETFFDVSYDPIRDESGKVGGVFCIVTETTGRVLGERRLKALRELSTRTAGMKTAEAVCEVAAAVASENAGDLPFVLFYLLDESGTRATLASSAGMPRGTPESPVEIDATDTAAIWHLDEGGRPRAVVSPMRKSGQVRASGFVVAGVSSRLTFDEEYRTFLDLLASQVGAAVANARSYEEEKRRAEALAELDRAKTAFFSNVSHEFRTPLSLMLGPVEDMIAAGNRELEVVHRNGLRLLRLVNTLLDVSRIEAGRVRATYRPTDLAALTADLASVFRAAIERAGLALVVDTKPLSQPVHVDRDMWEKIVLNLLSNAFKFTFDGTITIILSEFEGSARLTVRDTGTGIPEHELPLIFDRFHRIENARARTHEGSGIGLALVHDLVGLHGGTIEAESKLGVGTAFTVTIPFGSAHLPPEQIGGGPALASTRTAGNAYVEEALRWLEEPQGQKRPERAEGRILLADDNADMRDYVARLLSEQYEVEAVADGAAALAAARKHRPDLVLTDVMMPRLDGFALLRELRADPALCDVPVIMLSARAGEERRVEGLDAGADDYLVKPFGARELFARVGAHLRMAGLRREAGEVLRESESRFRRMADEAPVMIWVTEPDGSCTYLGKSWYEFTGQTQETGLGFGWLDAVHPADRPGVRDTFLTAHARGEAFRVEYRLRHRDGDYRWAIDAASPRFGENGALLGYIGSVIDITDRKRDEEALREADRRKDEFLALLAHELRGPLAPLRNTLEILRRAGNDPSALREASAMMDRQLGQLVRLVDDLLDVNRIARGRLELRRERVELAPLIEHAIEYCHPMTHVLRMDLPEQPIVLDADPVRLVQIFGNLVHNACKFTPQDGEISVSAACEGGEAVVCVRDRGVGIDPVSLPTIFDMFTQLGRSLDSPIGGLGIGLSIVKHLVELHGGTIVAESEGKGRGACFTVRLPLAVEVNRQPAPPALNRESPMTAPRRILVVDDNPDSATSLEKLLTMTGHEVRSANDGSTGVAEAERFRPEVVLLDIGLPRLNGYDACRLIREQPWGVNMILIAVTGWGQEDDRRRSREAGFDGHLVKPIDLDGLMKLLDEVTLDRKP